MHCFLTLPRIFLLIKSVLSSPPIYLFSILTAPSNILKTICNLQREFLWGGLMKVKKWRLVDWNKFCALFEGLDIKYPSLMGKPLAAKIWWQWLKILKELWEKVWTVKYASKIHQIKYIRMDGDRLGSIIWKNTWKNKDLF